jgi:hypothetical protein
MTHSQRLMLVSTFGVLVLLSGHGLAQAPQFRQEVVVQGVAPSGGSEFYLTFSAPIAIPGVSLAAGTYLFTKPAANILRVSSRDRRLAYAMVHTTPRVRGAVSDRHEILFGEPLADGAPQRIVAWFLPGETMGYELMYHAR